MMNNWFDGWVQARTHESCSRDMLTHSPSIYIHMPTLGGVAVLRQLAAALEEPCCCKTGAVLPPRQQVIDRAVPAGREHLVKAGRGGVDAINHVAGVDVASGVQQQGGRQVAVDVADAVVPARHLPVSERSVAQQQLSGFISGRAGAAANVVNAKSGAGGCSLWQVSHRTSTGASHMHCTPRIHLHPTPPHPTHAICPLEQGPLSSLPHLKCSLTAVRAAE